MPSTESQSAEGTIMGILDKILGRNKAPADESTGQPSPLGEASGEKEPKAAQDGGGEKSDGAAQPSGTTPPSAQ
jgi:hypothetical protein